MVIDTGGGQTYTVTKNSWRITHTTNHRTALSGYQDKTTQVCPIVNAVTKAHVKGLEQPVLLSVNYATLIDDKDETESLIVPFCMMTHGINIDMVPEKYGGKSGMTVNKKIYLSNMMMKNCSLKLKNHQNKILIITTYSNLLHHIQKSEMK